MKVQRVVANNLRQAKEQAIRIGGPDVLIVSTGEVGGKVELILAVDADKKDDCFSLPNHKSEFEKNPQDFNRLLSEIRPIVGRQIKAAPNSLPASHPYKVRMESTRATSTEGGFTFDIKEEIKTIYSEIKRLRSVMEYGHDQIPSNCQPLIEMLIERGAPYKLIKHIREISFDSADGNQLIQKITSIIDENLKNDKTFNFDKAHQHIVLIGENKEISLKAAFALARTHRLSNSEEKIGVIQMGVRGELDLANQIHSSRLKIGNYSATSPQDLRMLVGEIQTSQRLILTADYESFPAMRDGISYIEKSKTVYGQVLPTSASILSAPFRKDEQENWVSYFFSNGGGVAPWPLIYTLLSDTVQFGGYISNMQADEPIILEKNQLLKELSRFLVSETTL
jgi:hypothetical protein